MSPVRIAINGAAGRMGVELLKALHQTPNCEIAAAIVRAASGWVGEPLSVALGRSAPTLDFSATLDPDVAVDVLIDFSTPEAFDTALAIAVERRIPFVCGTTGFDRAHMQALRESAARIPVLWSANFSLSVALLKKMSAQAAAQLGPEFEAEILEIHHRFKRDAPSGTALAIGRAIAHARGQEFEDVARLPSQIGESPRAQHHIGFAVMRAADVVGEHTVVFASNGERLELTHRANSRAIFATGAVRCAMWLARQRPGWYEVGDALG
jgi:4-hydroxy-tetrahydrodipicolinate reductase